MNAKEFLKPSVFKVLAFVFIGIFYLYSAGEDACGAGLFFAFCYRAYGFPFLYLVTGQIDNASSYIKTLPLGEYFSKTGNFLFNPAVFLLDIALIYLLACLISILFNKNKSNIEIPNKQ